MYLIKFFTNIFCLFSFLLYGEENGLDIKIKKEELRHTSRINSKQLLEIIDSQLKALRGKEIDKAYQENTSMEFRKKTSLDDFKKLVERFKPFSQNKLFQFQSFYTEDDIATFGGELHSIEGESIPVEYDFIQEDGKWKILGIQIYQNELSLPSQDSF